MIDLSRPAPPTPRVWAVGALCRAIGDALDTRFNPTAVRGEITGFSRASSGHCYFSLKDADGQMRCAMFRRAAALLDFTPRDGELVDVNGRLGVYESRGELQLVAESMARVGAGGLFEQFVRLKERLEAAGMFDSGRKRSLPTMPRGIGIVTSSSAAALHDVVSALRRRVPHIPVVFVPAQVQGVGAPADLSTALARLYAWSLRNDPAAPVDLILLVRGGGSMEDLWAFNDETLARTIAASPVPVVSGVGHETDFTIADFVADMRAPTPTAAAELAAPSREVLAAALDLAADALHGQVTRVLDRQAQRIDGTAARLGRPSTRMAGQQQTIERLAQALHYGGRGHLERLRRTTDQAATALAPALSAAREGERRRLERAALRLELLDPHVVLRRGYAWLEDARGHTVHSADQTTPGQALRATLADGELDLAVLPSVR